MPNSTPIFFMVALSLSARFNGVQREFDGGSTVVRPRGSVLHGVLDAFGS
jgi:hypothetical protein